MKTISPTFLKILLALCLGCGATSTSAQVAKVSSDNAKASSEITSAVEQIRSMLEPDGSSNDDFFVSQLDPVLVSRCTICHSNGATADLNGAKLLFSDSVSQREIELRGFIASRSDGSDWLLAKILGDQGHGGGPVLTQGSSDYNKFVVYLESLGLATGEEPVTAKSFWDDTSLEGRETTLRRASQLLAAKVPDQTAIDRAIVSDSALRSAILKLMDGEKFHDFLIIGANDRLLTDGLMRGVAFDFDFQGRFPRFGDEKKKYPAETPEELENIWDFGKPFFHQGEFMEGVRFGAAREPLELIAHVVMTDQSYKKVLTADYTMVNPFTEIVYQSDDEGLPFNVTDTQGFWDRRDATVFKPGRVTGYVLFDEQYEFFPEMDNEYIVSHSGMKTVPTAGVLSTPAWLARYPSTDTNRNRARARWTYYHFLDVDIEKSAPRSTDPDALADTNNPTMNNPACTVCHERMDPMAGAYQSFGDTGEYLWSWGGKDSLSESYKHPEWFGGEPGTSLYREGDTWYRDMRIPGFNGETASGDLDSLQWLGRAIANDPRFPRATVKFWWPAVFGAEALKAPEDPSLPFYDQQLKAFNAQSALIDELVEGFEQSGMLAKQLLADMIMSPWFRTNAVANPAISSDRDVELASVGSGRLLTPEELDRKTEAVFGRGWGGTRNAAFFFDGESRLSPESWGSFNSFYGGIDSAAVTKRNRDMTPLMSNVAENMAIEMACQVVIDEFVKPKSQRFVFDQLNASLDPLSLGAAVTEIGTENTLRSIANPATQLLEFSHPGGELKVVIDDTTLDPCSENSQGQWSCSHIGIHEISVQQGNQVVQALSGGQFLSAPNFESDTWTDDQGNVQWGGFNPDGRNVYAPWSGSYAALSWDLPAGDYALVTKIESLLPVGHHSESVTAEIAIETSALAEQTVSLNRDVGVSDSTQLLTKTLDFVTTGGDVSFRLEDISDEGCRQSSSGEWVCSHLTLNSVEVLKNGTVVQRLAGVEFENAPNADSERWLDENGQTRHNGWSDSDGFNLHTNQWLSVTWPLAAGDYTLRYKISGQLPDNHHNDSVTAEIVVKPAPLNSGVAVLDRSNNVNTIINPAREILSFSGGGDVRLRLADSTPAGCVQISEDQWRCSSLLIHEVILKKGGVPLAVMAGVELATADNVAIEPWYNNDTGDSGLRGDADSAASALRLHSGAYLDIEWSLEPGEYTVEVSWSSALDEGYPEDRPVVANLSVNYKSLDLGTPAAAAVSAQLDALYLRATNRRLSVEDNQALVRVIADYAKSVVAESGGRLDGGCNTWDLWGNDPDQFLESIGTDWNTVWDDPTGMKSAWTMVVHQLMTSYWYLHD